MEVISISDTDGKLPEIKEKFDLLIIAGNFTPNNLKGDVDGFSSWFYGEFENWAYDLNCDEVLIIPGNEDFWFEKKYHTEKNPFDEISRVSNNKIHVILNEIYYFFSKKREYFNIYGLSYSDDALIKKEKAFSIETLEYRRKLLTIKDDDIDIFVSNWPPFNRCLTDFDSAIESIGSVSLNWTIDRIMPRVVVSGVAIDVPDRAGENILKGIRYLNTSLKSKFGNQKEPRRFSITENSSIYEQIYRDCNC